EPAGTTLRRQLSAQPKMIKDEAFSILDSLDAGLTVHKTSPLLASLFRPSVQPYLISWMKYDPTKIIASLKIPVCIIQGTTDIQVEEEDARKLSAAQPSAKLIIIDGMNHVLKTAPANRAENMKTYNNPDLPIADKLVQEISSFIQ
ncbi:MAG TPA: alpha/beta hydrolase, partial [Chitinophagaceae bacterium]|nr:alpha/beta hydrolase [Chitinophagaceae bacterium]